MFNMLCHDASHINHLGMYLQTLFQTGLVQWLPENLHLTRYDLYTEVPFPINISTVSDRLNLIVFKHNCFFSAVLFILHIISIFNKHHE